MDRSAGDGAGCGMKASLGDSRELTNDNSGRLIVLAFVHPDAALDPPAVFALVIKQDAAPAAHVIFESYLGILLHTYLDCTFRGLVPLEKWFFSGFSCHSGSFGLEIERNSVHTVSEPCRAGAILENMAEMALAPRTVHFRTHHPVGAVAGRLDSVLDRGIETGPASPAIELRVRRKKLLTAPGASEDSLTVLLVEGAAPRSLGAVLPQHLILLGGEPGAPFVVVGGDVHRANLSDSTTGESLAQRDTTP